jgi:hypothetical protein
LDGSRREGQASLNKRCLLCSAGILLMLILPLSALGGAEGCWNLPADSYKNGGDRGDPLLPVLIQARGRCASAISCRHGGNSATSTLEAPCSFATEARRRLATKWSRPWWLDDSRWQKILAGRECTSCLLLFLGGNAWRTSTSGGRDTQILDCFDLLFSRVFSVKCKLLSSNSGFLERVLYKGFSAKLCTYHFNGRNTGIF